ncbi:MAG TPA: hypothetical protein DE179_14355, partial [Oceanospirillaceae bacterium]|nr:hypothetical protein [Oceanospirillaceae bacterium]
RDSNPRYLAVYTLSRRAPSATRTPHQLRRKFYWFKGQKATLFLLYIKHFTTLLLGAGRVSSKHQIAK